MKFNARPDRRYIRARYRSNRFVLVELTAPQVRREPARAPVNIAIVLDRSGSMGGAKIGLAKQAVHEALAVLDERDRFSLVVYDDQIDVVMESTLASTEAKAEARRRLEGVDARGSTNLAEGWLRGCQQVALFQQERSIARCLLITDGLANVGVTDQTELERHAAELLARGIVTSTFGIGADFNEFLLKGMSLQGGGNFAFIESAAQIRDFITSEIGEALEVVARDVRLVVKPDPGVLVEPLNDFTSFRKGDVTSIELRDLVSEQQVEVVLRLNFPYGEVGAAVRATFQLEDREGVLGNEPVELSWDYGDNRTNDMQPRDRDVDRKVAEQFAARAREQALELNRRGDYGGANARLKGVAEKIRGYAGSDSRLQALAAALDTDQRTYAAPVAPMQAKQMYFASVNMRRSRDAQGRAKKS